MSDVTKAVITDETAREILQEMQVANATNREQRNLMAEQAAAMRNIYEKMGLSAADSNCYFVPATYDGAEYALDGITFDDVLAAHESGKFLVLKIVYGGNVYLAPVVSYTYTENTSKVIQYFHFYAHANLEGTASGTYILRRNTTISTGAVTNLFIFSVSYMDSSKIACDVTIGETPYNTLDAALNAIVAALG